MRQHRRPRRRRDPVLAELELCDLVAMHLIRAIDDAKCPGRRVSLGEAEVFGSAGAAVRLDGKVKHPQSTLGAATLIMAISARLPCCPLVHRVGSLQHSKPDLADRNLCALAEIATSLHCEPHVDR
jgi:hypothetical protein